MKYTAKREYGETPNGNKIGGYWVVRDEHGEFVEVNQYRNDLYDKYKSAIKFEGI